MRRRIRIRIRIDVLGASIGRVIISGSSAGTAGIDGAVPPASPMMRLVVVVVVSIMPTPGVYLF